MSKAYRCDNCDKLFRELPGHRFLRTDEGRSEWRVSVHIAYNSKPDLTADICQPCTYILGQKLMALFTGHETEEGK